MLFYTMIFDDRFFDCYISFNLFEPKLIKKFEPKLIKKS